MLKTRRESDVLLPWLHAVLAMTNLKDIVFETDHYWVKRVPKGFEVYKTGLTHSTRVAIIGYAGDKGLQRAKQEIARREAASGTSPASVPRPSGRHHAKKKSPAQMDREIAETLEAAAMTPAQRERYRKGRKWGWPADLAFKVAMERPLEGVRSPWKPRGRGASASRTAHTTKRRAIRADRLGHPDRIMLDGKRLTVVSDRPIHLQDGTVKFAVNTEYSTVAHHVVLPADEMVEVGWA